MTEQNYKLMNEVIDELIPDKSSVTNSVMSRVLLEALEKFVEKQDAVTPDYHDHDPQDCKECIAFREL